MSGDGIVKKYLSDGLRDGYELDALTQKLLESGYTQDQIDSALHEINGGGHAAEVPSMPEQTPLQQTMNSSNNPYASHSSSSYGSQGKLGVFSKMGKAIAHPKQLFELTKHEGIGSAFKYQMVLLIIPFVLFSLFAFVALQVLFSVLSTFIGSAISGSDPSGFAAIGATAAVPFTAFLAVLFFVIVPLFTFVIILVPHLFVKLFGGQSSYGATYRTFIYASTPSVLFFFIPFINTLWTFILVLVGISMNHSISKWRAFFALITPYLLVMIFSFVVGIFIPADTTSSSSGSFGESGSADTGDFDFEYHEFFTDCASGGRIKATINNIGTRDIFEDDWVVHRIDGVEVDTWVGADVEVDTWGSVMWPSESYAPGVHVIELGLSESDVKTYEVVCE